MNQKLDDLYLPSLEQNIIETLANRNHISIRQAMDIYYRSKLARQIEAKEYGIENLSPQALAEDLMDNETELFQVQESRKS